LPSRTNVDVDLQVLQNAADDEVDQIRHVFGPMIESWRCRQYYSARLRESQHVLEMDLRVRRFARNEHETMPFLQANISGAFDERACRTLRNACQRSH